MPDFDMHLLESVTLLSSLNLFVSSESLACLPDGASLLYCALCFSLLVKIFVTVRILLCTILIYRNAVYFYHIVIQVGRL